MDILTKLLAWFFSSFCFLIVYLNQASFVFTWIKHHLFLLESSIICFCQSPFVYFFCAHIYYLHVHECLFVLLYITLCKAVYTKCFKKKYLQYTVWPIWYFDMPFPSQLDFHIFQWLFSGPVAFSTAAGFEFFQWLQWTSGLTCVSAAARAVTLPVHVAFVMYRFYPRLLFSFVQCVHFDIFICIARHCHWTESIGLRFLPASLWLVLSFLEYSLRQGLSTDQCQNKQTNKRTHTAVYRHFYFAMQNTKQH